MLSYHSVVLYVEDVERAKNFYCDFLSLKIDLDMGKNVILEKGITLWEISDENIIVKSVGKDNLLRGNKFELYFETMDLDTVSDKINEYGIEKLHEIHEEPWGQRTIRIYDYDKNIIEIGEDLKSFLERLAKNGMKASDLCSKTGMKKEDIEKIIGYELSS